MSKTEIQVHIPDSISWTAYRALAARTEAPAAGILHGCDDHRALTFVRKAHAIIGVDTELDEIAEVFVNRTTLAPDVFRAKLAEELGDLCWYAVILEDYVAPAMERVLISIGEALLEAVSGPTALLQSSQANLRQRFLDAGKRELIYAPTATPEKAQGHAEVLHTQWLHVCSFCSYAAADNGLEAGRIWATNIRKLLIRYAKKFDSQEAFDRDLEAEFKLLHADATRTAQG